MLGRVHKLIVASSRIMPKMAIASAWLLRSRRVIGISGSSP